MTTLLFTRPHQWAEMTLPGYNLVHAPVFGPEPKLRGGQPMGDDVGGLVDKAGFRLLVDLFEQHKPDAFLFWPMYGRGDGDKRQLESVVKAIATCKSIAPKCVFLYGNGNQASVLLERKPDWNVGAYEKWIDVVLDNTDDPCASEVYTRHGLRHVMMHQFGFDPDTFPDFAGTPARYDAYFGGSYTGMKRFPNSRFRHNLFTTIDKKFNLLVSGRGKWPVKNKRNHRYAADHIAMFGEAKVALGCNHADLHRYYTKRTVYALASGRPYLVKYIPGMDDDFINGQHLIWCRTVGEVQTGLRLLLDPEMGEERRLFIGTEGRSVAIRNHSWKARLAQFGEILDSGSL